MIIWKNPSPNAASTCRPIYLLRASEDEQRVKDLVPSTTDEGRKELMEGPVHLTSEKQVFEVNHVIHSSMKDLKLKKAWSGLAIQLLAERHSSLYFTILTYRSH